MSAKKLVVSTYLQYILIAISALLLFMFVRQLGGVLPTFLLAVVFLRAELSGPAVRSVAGPEGRGACHGGSGRADGPHHPRRRSVQPFVQNLEVLMCGVTRLSAWPWELPYVGERIEAVDQTVVTHFLQSNAPSAGQVLTGALGFIGGVFGVFSTALNLLLMHRERISDAALRAVPVTVWSRAPSSFTSSRALWSDTSRRSCCCA